MSGLGESKKRDFVSQLTVILGQNATLLTEKGFDPATKIAQLETELTAADQAEGRQTEAKAAAKSATIEAQDTLQTAYDGKSIRWCRNLKNCASTEAQEEPAKASNRFLLKKTASPLKRSFFCSNTSIPPLSWTRKW